MVSIIVQKQVKTATMDNVLQRAWEGFGGIKITEVVDRVMLINFENEETLKQIFDMSPGLSKDTT